jgi:hypothetical protein
MKTAAVMKFIEIKGRPPLLKLGPFELIVAIPRKYCKL